MNCARNCENLLNFVKVIPKTLLVPFFSGHGVVQQIDHSKRLLASDYFLSRAHDHCHQALGFLAGHSYCLLLPIHNKMINSYDALFDSKINRLSFIWIMQISTIATVTITLFEFYRSVFVFNVLLCIIYSVSVDNIAWYIFGRLYSAVMFSRF